MTSTASGKRVALVSAHFPPSNLVGVHRARLWSQYLPEFGWTPTIVTTHQRYYEEKNDPDLLGLVPKDLRIIHTPALPIGPVRLVGDIGIRGFWWHYRALCDLARRNEIDFVLVTIPSNFSAPLGRLVHRRFGLPYGIDYQDPWVHYWPGARRAFSRAWGSHQLSLLLEPWAVRDAALITGIAPGYFAGMLERNPAVAARAVTASMPMGGSAKDFDYVRANPRPTFLFNRDDGLFHLIYAGALLPAGVSVLRAFLQGVGRLAADSPATAQRLRLHFVGTGRSPDDPQGHQVLPIARELSVDHLVEEHPQRIGYVDTLNHLVSANGVLVLGSTERHYTPSKLFQAVLSGRPVFAMLHEASTAVSMLRSAHAGQALAFGDGELPQPAQIATELGRLLDRANDERGAVDWSVFDAYSARNSARLLAEALDRAVDLRRR
jgi:hypothetical protein